MSMKVYSVEQGEYSDYHICGIFSTKERAEKYKSDGGGDRVVEWDVDEFAEYENRVLYQSQIDILTGGVKELENSSALVDPKLRAPEWHAWSLESVQQRLGHMEFPRLVHRQSYVSQDHANKLCVETRQSLLAMASGYKLSPGRNEYWLLAEKIDA